MFLSLGFDRDGMNQAIMLCGGATDILIESNTTGLLQEQKAGGRHSWLILQSEKNFWGYHVTTPARWIWWMHTGWRKASCLDDRTNSDWYCGLVGLCYGFDDRNVIAINSKVGLSCSSSQRNSCLETNGFASSCSINFSSQQDLGEELLGY